MAADGSPPVITFQHLSEDFGAMPESETRTAVFPFTNTGGSVLKIFDIKAISE